MESRIPSVQRVAPVFEREAAGLHGSRCLRDAGEVSPYPEWQSGPPCPARAGTHTARAGGNVCQLQEPLLSRSLAEIWADVLGVERVGINDNFFELGGHSLLAVRLFVRIRKWAGCDLPLATLFRSPTVRELAELLDPGSAAAPISGETSSDVSSSVQQWRSLVPIQPKGKRLPLFLMHAGGGNVLNYLPLLPHLGPDQPVYGLQPDSTGVSAPLLDCKIAEHTSQIRSVHPSGPYFIRRGVASDISSMARRLARRMKG